MGRKLVVFIFQNEENLLPNFQNRKVGTDTDAGDASSFYHIYGRILDLYRKIRNAYTGRSVPVWDCLQLYRHRGDNLFVYRASASRETVRLRPISPEISFICAW